MSKEVIAATRIKGRADECPGCESGNDAGVWYEVPIADGYDEGVRCEGCYEQACCQCGRWCGEGACRYERVCPDCHDCRGGRCDEEWFPEDAWPKRGEEVP